MHDKRVHRGHSLIKGKRESRRANDGRRRKVVLCMHRKPTRKRKWPQPRLILEWLAVLTALTALIKLMVEVFRLLS